MSTPELLHTLTGTWTGTSRLYLPGEPTRESPSNASVTLIAREKFCTIAYTWVFDGEPQEGLLMLGAESERSIVNALFVDSWHMGDKFMILEGKGDTTNAVVLHGSYAVEGGPDWGWKIVVEPGNTTLRILMYNVLPDGEEFLGVEATYTRST